jgi:Ca2+-transporting ATPase
MAQEHFQTDTAAGLSTSEVRQRRKQYGPNRIQREKSRGVIKLLLEQFTSPLILILIAAALMSWGVGYLPDQEPKTLDAILILIIVVVSGLLGFFQNYRAERTLEALKKMAGHSARVIRDGTLTEVPLREIVPGDVVTIEGGDVIPADARITEATRLSVNEAPLTGESEAVDKAADDTVFMNTYVYGGEATGIVQATGMDTKMGEIADELQNIEDDATPFTKQLNKFARTISIGAGFLIIVTMIIGLFRYGVYESLLTAVSLAVAAIPEGLPAIITLTLAIGARAMSRKKALIRKMSVTESIGTVDVICADKTGTITKNEMTVTQLRYAGNDYHVDDMDEESWQHVTPLIRAGVLCNSAHIGMKDGEETYLGDATETASLKLGARREITQEGLSEQYEHIDKVPFSAERKRSTHVYSHGDTTTAYIKGAPEVILQRCVSQYDGEHEQDFSEETRQALLERVDALADQGLRVLAFAYKRDVSPNDDADAVESELVFLGLQAMMDPPHEGIADALKETRQAGIDTLMLTGDNPNTAQAIASKVGLQSNGVMTGDELEETDDAELKRRIDDGLKIFARVSPFHKLRILKLLRNDHHVAMTGDGVNDVLALKRADVGIAMGKRGTEVAKEASDIILLNDSYLSIVAAIREGRRIFDNVRKFINYLSVTNIAEVLVIFILTTALTLKEPLLLPVHLLWINLLTDGLPALALGADPARRDTMQRPPRRKNEPIVNRRLGIIIASISVLITALLIAMYAMVSSLGPDVVTTTLFTGFIILELLRIAVVRQQEELSWGSNPWLLWAIAFTIVLQLLLLYTPINTYFHVVPLGMFPWLVILFTAAFGFIAAMLITNLIIKYVK